MCKNKKKRQHTVQQDKSFSRNPQQEKVTATTLQRFADNLSLGPLIGICERYVCQGIGSHLQVFLGDGAGDHAQFIFSE